MRFIPLTQGKFAVVDDEDYAELSRHKWCTHKAKRIGGVRWYARRNIAVGVGKQASIFMHRVLLNTTRMVDHADGNGLNNQRSNLRDGSNGGNGMNCVKTLKPTSSRFKGVTLHKKSGKWQAQACFKGKEYYLGFFATENDAACAYDYFARKHFGEFARLNFPESTERRAIQIPYVSLLRQSIRRVNSTGQSDTTRC